LYDTLALPALLCSSAVWSLKARGSCRVLASEMKYMRKTVGRTWTDYKTNTEIAE